MDSTLGFGESETIKFFVLKFSITQIISILLSSQALFKKNFDKNLIFALYFNSFKIQLSYLKEPIPWFKVNPHIY